MCVSLTGIPSQVHSCLMPRVPRIGSESIDYSIDYNKVQLLDVSVQFEETMRALKTKILAGTHSPMHTYSQTHIYILPLPQTNTHRHGHLGN